MLRHCEKLTDSSQPRAQALNTANLWDYVCRKVSKPVHMAESFQDYSLIQDYEADFPWKVSLKILN